MRRRSLPRTRTAPRVPRTVTTYARSDGVRSVTSIALTRPTSTPPFRLGELTDMLRKGGVDVEAPVGVRRAGRERAHDRLERRNVAGGEDRARVFRIAPALAVVEGRKELALPAQDLAGGV